MKLSCDAVKINSFDKFLNFIHASSPRYFENEKGTLEQYSFAAKNDLGKNSDHMKRFMQTVKTKNKIPYLLNQVHSDQIFLLKDVSQTQDQVSKVKADALITHLDETPIGVFTADCIPVLLYDTRLHVVSAIHAGRMGTQKNIVNKTIIAMKHEYGCLPQDLIAGLGPGIGGCCYEVDQDCLSLFEKKIPYVSSFVKVKENGKFLLDLFAVNIKQALDAGLLFENIFPSGECTFCSPRNHFSFRREGQTGRILTFIMLQKSVLK